MGEVSAYPLTWPIGRPRTPANERTKARFQSKAAGGGRVGLKLTDARSRLADELDRLHARFVVLSTNLELRADGQPRAGLPEPTDVGVAVYFQLYARPIVLACDRWITVAGNMAAIAAHIDALRGQDRWGVGSVEQAFAGFAALPAPMVPNDWRAALGEPTTIEEAEAAYRALMKKAHPDAGGSHAIAAALNAAIAAARTEMPM